jgi:ParB family chromosome partitioning protein
MTNGLGRGLGSLIPQKINKKSGVLKDAAPVSASSENNNERDKVLNISPEKIKVNREQPRKRFAEHEMEELSQSIKEYGVIQPLIAIKKDGEYELIAGERRLRAAKMIGLKTVPLILREADKQARLEIALIENLQREDLNPIEEALAYKKLIDEFNLTQEEIAKKVGKARPTVANNLRLLNLPEEIQLALIDGRLDPAHAKIIVGLDTEEKQMALFRKIIHSGITFAGALTEARRMGGTKEARIKINYADKEKEFVFREFFKTKAEIKRKRKGGQIIVNFYSDEELDEIINKLKINQEIDN